MVRYIWQLPTWPDFRWDSTALLRPFGEARQAQGHLLGMSRFFELELQVQVLTEEAFTTAAIEGEKLNREAVRSSVARRLGLPTADLPPADRNVDGLIEMLIDATRNYGGTLSASRLKAWQAALFPTGYSGLRRIVVGDWRHGNEPQQVVSGPIGKERSRYEAPPSSEVGREVKAFLGWFGSSRDEWDGLIRAATAHFRFVCIHPFEDGNGRVARAIADMALAQDENNDCRLYSMSAQVMSEREDYYAILERTQKGDGDITGWLKWFLGCFTRSIENSSSEVQKAMAKARFWQDIGHLSLSERQSKVVNKLFESGPGGFEGGLTNRKYQGMTGTTRETARRDIVDLIKKGVLVRNQMAGRNVHYDLAWPK
jgi:Fic family protein